MIKKLDHFVITSKDSSATVAFYEKLGFTIQDKENRFELYAGDFKINVHILGKELHPHAEHIQVGSSDFCFEIETDMKVFYHHLQDKGLDIELGIVKRQGVFGEVQSIYLRDPDGNLVEFCSYE